MIAALGILLPIHVAAGGLAIVLGFVALSASKGGPVHRHGGLGFVLAILVMGGTASLLELRDDGPGGNALAGLLTAYFVGTALTTVRPPSRWTRRIDLAALAVVVGLALATLVAGGRLVGTPGLNATGVPFRTVGVMSLVLAAAMALAASGDVRVLRGGRPRGGRRLARHLWRMCFALWIATASFFSIEERVARVLPDPFTSAPLRALPVVLVLGAMLGWLWRVRDRRPADPDRRAAAARPAEVLQETR